MPEPVLDLPFIVARAVHFASTGVTSGIFLFLAVIADPIFASMPDRAAPAIAALRARLVGLAWWALVISIASAALWLVLLSAAIGGCSPMQALSSGTVQAVLTRTQFGRAWQARCGLAVLLALAALRMRSNPATLSAPRSLAAPTCAMCFLGALAWAGHGAASPGLWGQLQLGADVLHLMAAGAWVGGLLPLALLLSAAGRVPDQAWASSARDATLRFSTLGMATVATLIVTGFINACALLGSVPALFTTEYGRVLLLKLGVFLSMLTIAAINRSRLTPRLVAACIGPLLDTQPMRRLRRNCLIEIALGFVVIGIVAALGTMSPMHR